MWASVGTFFAGKLGKGLLVIIALTALAGAVFGIVKAMDNFIDDVYDSGFAAGSDQKEKQWEKANALAMKGQRDQVVTDAKNSNDSVMSYLQDILAREPEILRVKERTTIYEKSADGSVVCLDAGGVRLIREHREALGLAPRSAPTNPGAVLNSLPGPGPDADGTGRNSDPSTDGSQ